MFSHENFLTEAKHGITPVLYFNVLYVAPLNANCRLIHSVVV